MWEPQPLTTLRASRPVEGKTLPLPLPWVQRDSDPRKTTLARASCIYKRQTRPLVREGALQKQDRNCQRVINIWSWAPDGALYQDLLIDWSSVAMWFWQSLWLEKSLETAVRRVGGWCEMAASLGISQLEQWVIIFVRQSPTSKDVIKVDEEATALKVVTRRQPVTKQQTEKSSFVLYWTAEYVNYS
jgi:hypothetical protein